MVRTGWIAWLVRSGWPARKVRRWRLDTNPLRRSLDRIETVVMAGLMALFLAAAPLCWMSAGRWVHQAGVAEQHAQRSWREIPGIVLRGASQRSRRMMARMPSDATTQALTAWTGTDGRRRTGEVTVPLGTMTGARVPVWVTPSGRVTSPPLTPAQLSRRVVGIQLLVLTSLAAVLVIAARLVRGRLNRHRLAAWELQWALVGPRWSRHR